MCPVGSHGVGGGDGTKSYWMLIGALVAHNAHTADSGQKHGACLLNLVVERYLYLAVGHLGGHSGCQHLAGIFA